MKFAILTDAGATPIVGQDLADRVKARLREKVRLFATRGECENAIDAAFDEEEADVRRRTNSLGSEHS